MNPPGPMENILRAAATVSLKGERGRRRRKRRRRRRVDGLWVRGSEEEELPVEVQWTQRLCKPSERQTKTRTKKLVCRTSRTGSGYRAGASRRDRERRPPNPRSAARYRSTARSVPGRR
ncbi:hypothetical protein EYF80_050049 [Liparis tanakae]|uniref:DAD domain-containing protein n=1 Tax=Liparis tanakae TaxID=230148 RepID=A0A4Z2FFW1_9TELE|nr:hypothetical protein EYF80_050049 [Liparis tanakae]